MAKERQHRANAAVEIRNLYKIFGPHDKTLIQQVKQGLSKEALKAEHNHVLGLSDINLTMASGQIQVIMGLSGSGKSTLIRHINRLIDPTEGEILVDGVDVMKLNLRQLREFRREYTAMVFQKFALLPHYTIQENVEFGLSIRGVPRKKREESAHHWIERVGLQGYEASYPNQLSGGMQQRVGLARALADDSPIMLMDEAFSALDPLIRSDMQEILLDLQAELSKTIIFITHDLEEALRLGDNIAILRDGKLIQQASGQKIVMHPADDYVAQFVKSVNKGRVVRCRTIMDKTIASHPNLPNINSETLVEAAAGEISAAGLEAANIVNKKGVHLGGVKLDELIQLMVSTN